jgi:hypothetical protein
MEKHPDQRLRQAIIEVVNAQLKENDPPETKQTLERLRRQGFTEQEALKLIGYVVASEVFAVLKEGRPYDAQKFLAALQALPTLPWQHD